MEKVNAACETGFGFGDVHVSVWTAGTAYSPPCTLPLLYTCSQALCAATL